MDRLRHRTTLRLEQHLVRYSRLGGDTAQNSKMFEKQWGDTAHSKFGYMVRSSNKGGNIAQSSTMLQKPRGGHRTFHLRLSCKIIKQENPYGRWVGGSFRKYYHFVAPSCKLELTRFSAWLRIQDGAECGNILYKKFFHQRARGGINNSISCLDNSVSCSENQF